ncbi:MAG: hypothetical protein Q9196_006939 [Gyalolechia fulgens]
MSNHLLSYVLILHMIKTDFATQKSSREAGFLDAETANDAARTMVLRQSGLPAEDWDEYNEKIVDDGEITIHGAIDTMQIVCFVWTRDEDYEHGSERSETTEEIDQVEHTNAELNTLPQEQRRSIWSSLVSLGLLGLAVVLIADIVLYWSY